MKMKWKAALAAGGALTVIAAAVALTDRRGDDGGGIANSRMDGGAPVARNDPMSPVAHAEASKRATANEAQAEAARQDGGSYYAPPVIVGAEPPRKGERLEVETVKPLDLPPAAPPPAAQQPAASEPIMIYAYQRPVADDRLRARIQAQIEAVLKPGSGGFSVRTLGPAEPPATAAPSAGSSAAGGGAVGGNILAARPGDVAMATLDRGFSSVDPQGPIFATIYDYRDGGKVGPLHGARVLGTISYSKEQAAVTFNSLILPSGYQMPIKGLAISEETGRSGVAASVDKHEWERYSGLFVASLIQGAGQVGQELVSNSQDYVVTPAGTVLSSSTGVNWGEAALGMVLPLGNALSSVAAQQFNKPATITSPPTMGLGIVFVEPVQVPMAQVQQSAAILSASRR